MAETFLSVIIPAYNEEGRIASTLGELLAHLITKPYTWEIIVANDGSTDRTAEIVRDFATRDPRVRLTSLPHHGKGWAVKQGMLQASGEWRFMCDADLSMPAEQIDRFVPNGKASQFDIGIGSREVAGSRRIAEPAWRHLIGRVFNTATRLLAVPELNDTQCGFKIYRGAVVTNLFNLQTLNGFGFDVEILYLGRKSGIRIREVAIDWYYRPDSKVGLTGGVAGFIDIVRVRWNDFRGRYRVRQEAPRQQGSEE